MVIIQDIADVTVRHMKTFSPTTGKKAMTIFQEAYPANPKAMYFLGMPSFMTSIFNVMMSFSKEKFKQRIQLVAKDDFAKLHEELGIEILPKEYGGTNGAVQDHLGNKDNHNQGKQLNDIDNKPVRTCCPGPFNTFVPLIELYLNSCHTVPIGRIISAKNARAWLSMDFI